MHVEKYMRGAVTVLVLKGELDSVTAAEAHTGLMDLLPVGGRVLLDLSEVSYISSAGLRVLLLVYREARHKDVPLALAGVPAEARVVMSATGFLDAFVVADTVAEGVEALGR
ncbi:STAS domain-containing protein [Kitasatospora sp. NPDC005856]|uniref:STAS domain-containing protein n=1 Tax=Kitasatospora sp. NPDC005856 TaxID=3154566 RepID=UPI0033D85111